MSVPPSAIKPRALLIDGRGMPVRVLNVGRSFCIVCPALEEGYDQLSIWEQTIEATASKVQRECTTAEIAEIDADPVREARGLVTKVEGS